MFIAGVEFIAAIYMMQEKCVQTSLENGLWRNKILRQSACNRREYATGHTQLATRLHNFDFSAIQFALKKTIKITFN